MLIHAQKIRSIREEFISRDENKLRSVSFCSRDQSAISGIQFEIIQKRELGCGCINSVLGLGLCCVCVRLTFFFMKTYSPVEFDEFLLFLRKHASKIFFIKKNSNSQIYVQTLQTRTRNFFTKARQRQ